MNKKVIEKMCVVKAELLINRGVETAHVGNVTILISWGLNLFLI